MYKRQTQDATFTAEEQERTTEAERELDKVLDASGMDVLRSLDPNFGRDTGDDDTGEATGAPRPETRGQSFEFNQAFPEDENGNTLVRDEEGTTHTLNRNQAGAYRQLWNMTPSFARHLLNTKQAIKFAGALIQNRGGSQDVYNKQITQEAQKIVKLVLNTLGDVKMANTIFEGFINGEWESVDAVSKEAGRNLQVDAKTARMFRDASQWLSLIHI